MSKYEFQNIYQRNVSDFLIEKKEYLSLLNGEIGISLIVE
jgi:hypothetical protein